MTTSVSSIITKYSPKTLDEYTTFDLKTKMVIYGYPKGTLTKPLLLAGPPGVGKTQLARLIAASIPGMTLHDIEEIDVSQDTSINTVRRIGNIVNTFARNERNLRVVILDEADNFSVPAMNALKGLLTTFPSIDKGVFFILTTNHPGSISNAVRDRCKELFIPATTVDDVLPMAKRVLDGEGIPYTEPDIRTALSRDNTGLATFRDMWDVIETIITLRSMQA